MVFIAQYTPLPEERKQEALFARLVIDHSSSCVVYLIMLNALGNCRARNDS
jgi:hypothetical protein